MVVEEVVVFTGLPPSMKGIVAVRSNVLERNFIVFFVFLCCWMAFELESCGSSLVVGCCWLRQELRSFSVRRFFVPSDGVVVTCGAVMD